MDSPFAIAHSVHLSSSPRLLTHALKQDFHTKIQHWMLILQWLSVFEAWVSVRRGYQLREERSGYRYEFYVDSNRIHYLHPTSLLSTDMNSIWIEFHARPIDTFSINCRAYKNVEIYIARHSLSRSLWKHTSYRCRLWILMAPTGRVFHRRESVCQASSRFQSWTDTIKIVSHSIFNRVTDFSLKNRIFLIYFHYFEASASPLGAHKCKIVGTRTQSIHC